jgi:hypothetical protein
MLEGFFIGVAAVYGDSLSVVKNYRQRGVKKS